MADATEPAVSANNSPTTLTSSHAANRPTSLGELHHREAAEDISQPLPSTRLAADPSTVATPPSRRPLALLTINTTPITRPSSSHLFTPSPAPTEIVSDVEPTEMTTEDRIATLLAEGIKVRDFIYESAPKSPTLYCFSSPTLAKRVRMRCNAGFRTNPDDLPDSEFFRYNSTGHSDEEHPLTPPGVEAETEGAGEWK